MTDKTSTGQTSYQGCGSDFGRGLGRGSGNVYGRGWGCGFNPTKLEVWGKCEDLGSDVYSIIDVIQEEKYTIVASA